MTGDAIDFDNSPEGTILRNTTIRHGNGFNIDAVDFGKVSFTGFGSKGTVEQCHIYDFSDKGVSVGEGALGVTIKGCLIHNVSTGISVKDSSLATILNNTLVNNMTGIDVVEKNIGLGGGHASGYNNIIWGNDSSIYINSNGTATIDSSIISKSTQVFGTGNINSDPLFINPSINDYSLSTQSPAIGSGKAGSNMGAIFPVGGYVLPQDYLQVSDPNYADKLMANSTHPISWTNGTNILNIKIGLSIDGGLQWSEIISKIDASLNSFNWTVPNVYSSRCKVRITDITDSTKRCTSYGFFTILPNGIEKAALPVFSQIGGFYTNSFELTLSCQPNEIIYYTLDGSDPTDNSFSYTNPLTIKSDSIPIGFNEVDIKSTTEPTYPISYIRSSPISQEGVVPTFWEKPKGIIFKATIIKARTYSPNKGLSDIVTHSYFVDQKMLSSRYTFPIISITTDIHNLFDYYKGIYIPGSLFDGNEFTGNYELRGSVSEIPAHIEMYETNGTRAFSQNIGVRIRGEWIRTLSQKTLNLYARSEYDLQNKFQYPIFPDLNKNHSLIPLTEFKRLILRNSGNEFPFPDFNSLLRDKFAQSLFQHMNFKIQARRFSIVFINGEYWGIQEIMENNDERSIASHFNLNRDSIVIMEDNLEGINLLVTGNKGDEKDFLDIVNYIKTNDLTIASNYNYIKSKIDIESFCDHWIATIFVGKNNYEHNVSFWKYKGKPFSQYGADGKWRWLGNDFDDSFRDMNVSFNTLVSIINSGPSYLLSELIKNNEFKTCFLNRFADQLNSAFKLKYIQTKLHETYLDLYPEITEHLARWGTPLSLAYWENSIKTIDNYLQKRDVIQKQYLKSYFKVDTVKVILNTNNNEGEITINTISINKNTLGLEDTLNPYPWKGTYYTNNLIRVEAMAYPGYRFVKWLENNSINKLLSLELTKDTIFTAIFELDTTPTKKLYINEIMASNTTTIKDEYNQYADWIEIYNDHDDTVDIGGYYVTDKSNSFRIPSGFNTTKIPPHGFLLLWADGNPSQGECHLNFKLAKEGDFIALYDKDFKTLIDSLSYGEQYSDVSFGRKVDGSEIWNNYLFPTPGVSNSQTNIEQISIKNNNLTIFPNPSNGILFITSNNSINTDIQLSVFNLVGQELFYEKLKFDINSPIKLDLSHLSKGTYLIKINGELTNEIKRIIIQ